MNVYDFDQTVFYPDSSYCFVMYCLRHYPRAVLSGLPRVSLTGLKYWLGKTDIKEIKESMFSFLPLLENVEQVVEDFWKEHRDHLEGWYLRQKRPDDLILSASPEFLLRPICDDLGVSLIATNMDPCTGLIRGLNCHDEEKVRRLRLEYPDAEVESFYSDSLSDTPMSRIARRAFLVKRGSFQSWPE